MKFIAERAWCTWHEHWTSSDTCPHCADAYPVCYRKAHLQYSCLVYPGQAVEDIPQEPVRAHHKS